MSVFGEFLRPELGDRIGLPPTVPLAGTCGPSLQQEHVPERIRESKHTILSLPVCRCTTATILPPFRHLAAAFVSHGRIAGAQVPGRRRRHDGTAPARRAAHAHAAGAITQGDQIRLGYPARLPMSAYRCLCTPLGRGGRARAVRDGGLPPLPWSCAPTSRSPCRVPCCSRLRGAAGSAAARGRRPLVCRRSASVTSRASSARIISPINTKRNKETSG